MTDTLPRVSIGLPTYNRPELLESVLESFRRQTFSDFELIVSDNASPDPRVSALCERYAAQDSRFRYVRQPVNRGVEENFWYVYDQARGTFFLWASDDDEWSVDFLERGVAALERNPRASAWFCQVVNINVHGRLVREYPSFNRFRSTRLRLLDLARFLWEPEIMGKANLIFSIFRRDTLRDVIAPFRGCPSSWGFDMNLMYGYLCRFNLLIDDKVALRKRVFSETIEAVSNPRWLIYPWEERPVYFENYRKAASGTRYLFWTVTILMVRFTYDRWFHERFSVQRWFRRWLTRFYRIANWGKK